MCAKRLMALMVLSVLEEMLEFQSGVRSRVARGETR